MNYGIEQFTHVVCDLDGTLCNVAHRAHHAQAGEWEEFHKRCLLDYPYPNIARLLHILSGHCSIVACTGRNEKWRQMTFEWLKLHSLAGIFEDVLMRPDDDYSADADLKLRLLTEYFEDPFSQILLVIEDRPKVVQALRDKGLTVLQAREGDY